MVPRCFWNRQAARTGFDRLTGGGAMSRAVAAGVATQVAAEFARWTGSKTAGTISKAVVRGALGGVPRRWSL